MILMEENDHFASHDDKNYTQGSRISHLSGAVTPDGWWDQPYGWLNDNFPIFEGGDRKRKYEWTIAGQSLFTPTNTSLTDPSLKDRPYAAWLYTGTSLLQETAWGSHQTLENAELLVGIVGAPALGSVTQNDFHQFIDVSPAMGWKNQIKTEPGFIASYERKWRFQELLIGNLAVDAIPELGVSAGNILTYGEAGGTVRFGQNLGADYGVDRIRPSLSGTAWFDPDKLNGNIGWYVFIGAQSRIIGRNMFLDGNSFRSSPSVEKKLFVTDFVGGASLFWSSAIRVDFTMTERMKEFFGQRGAPNRFGGINLVFQI
jgi:lipid A 3-O-deacylase